MFTEGVTVNLTFLSFFLKNSMTSLLSKGTNSLFSMLCTTVSLIVPVWRLITLDTTCTYLSSMHQRKRIFKYLRKVSWDVLLLVKVYGCQELCCLNQRIKDVHYTVRMQHWRFYIWKNWFPLCKLLNWFGRLDELLLWPKCQSSIEGVYLWLHWSTRTDKDQTSQLCWLEQHWMLNQFNREKDEIEKEMKTSEHDHERMHSIHRSLWSRDQTRLCSDLSLLSAIQSPVRPSVDSWKSDSWSQHCPLPCWHHLWDWKETWRKADFGNSGLKTSKSSWRYSRIRSQMLNSWRAGVSPGLSVAFCTSQWKSQRRRKSVKKKQEKKECIITFRSSKVCVAQCCIHVSE